MKVCLSLMKTLLRPFAKFVLIPLGLTAAASATDAGIHKNFLGSGMSALITSKIEMEYIMKIITSIEKSVSKAIKNEEK